MLQLAIKVDRISQTNYTVHEEVHPLHGFIESEKTLRHPHSNSFDANWNHFLSLDLGWMKVLIRTLQLQTAVLVRSTFNFIEDMNISKNYQFLFTCSLALIGKFSLSAYLSVELRRLAGNSRQPYKARLIDLSETSASCKSKERGFACDGIFKAEQAEQETISCHDTAKSESLVYSHITMSSPPAHRHDLRKGKERPNSNAKAQTMLRSSWRTRTIGRSHFKRSHGHL